MKLPFKTTPGLGDLDYTVFLFGSILFMTVLLFLHEKGKLKPPQKQPVTVVVKK